MAAVAPASNMMLPLRSAALKSSSPASASPSGPSYTISQLTVVCALKPKLASPAFMADMVTMKVVDAASVTPMAASLTATRRRTSAELALIVPVAMRSAALASAPAKATLPPPPPLVTEVRVTVTVSAPSIVASREVNKSSVGLAAVASATLKTTLPASGSPLTLVVKSEAVMPVPATVNARVKPEAGVPPLMVSGNASALPSCTAAAASPMAMLSGSLEPMVMTALRLAWTGAVLNCTLDCKAESESRRRLMVSAPSLRSSWKIRTRMQTAFSQPVTVGLPTPVARSAAEMALPSASENTSVSME